MTRLPATMTGRQAIWLRWINGTGYFKFAVVDSGGNADPAGGTYSTIGGGTGRRVTGVNDYQAGSLFETQYRWAY